MSNSSLVCHTNISPNRSSPRNHEIDTVTIHCVVGQVSAESLGNWFSKSTTGASSNYGVDKDGRIGMYVEEKDRSWCTSNRDNDNRSITIEVASDTSEPYAVTDAAYSGLIKLLVDICKRNPGIRNLRWKNDKSLIGQVDQQNMTVHRWFANKSCPGEYLFSRHGDIVDKVNQLLRVDAEETVYGVPNSDEVIWNFFKSKGLNDFAVAGILGNLDAESGLRSNNLQNGYETSLCHTDSSYTKAVDNGTYTNFIFDGAGYGLAQWTYYSRKRALLEYAQKSGKSVGDLGMQLEFLWSELQEYKSVVEILRRASSVLEASNAILLEYERPADHGTSVQNKRARLGQSFYDKFVNYQENVVTAEQVILYRVRKLWNDSGSQLGAFRILSNAKAMADKNPGYFVFDQLGNVVYPEMPKDSSSADKSVPAQSDNVCSDGQYRVTARSGLNMRRVPGVLSDGNIVMVVPYGSVVDCEYHTSVDGVRWLYVAYRGMVGYVHSGYVTKI